MSNVVINVLPEPFSLAGVSLAGKQSQGYLFYAFL